MFHKIMVPLDGSGLAEAALPHAAHLAASCGAEVLVVRALFLPVASPAAWNLVQVEELRRQEAAATELYLEDVARDLKTKGIQARALAREGDPAQTLLEMAEDEAVDLIVMTSHGRTGLKRWLFGSVAEKVVRHAPCPVLTVGARSLRQPEA